MRTRELTLLVLLAGTSIGVGCGGTPKRIVEAAPQFYPVGCEKEPWKIEGTFTEGEGYSDALRRTLTVKVDGQTAINGELSGVADTSGEVTGKHGDKKITAVCSTVPRGEDEPAQIRCVLMVDNERTVTLSF